MKSTRALLLGLVAMLASCSRVDGQPVDASTLGAHKCSIDVECGRGRYCGVDRLCAIDCLSAKDCVTSAEAPLDRTCSACGRCLPKTATDETCSIADERACSGDDECKSTLGPGWLCRDRACRRSCAGDDECSAVGRGFSCAPSGLCARRCFRPNDCPLFGFRYECVLPAGVDPVKNADADAPVLGECAARDAVDYGPAPTGKPASKYQGIWGWMVNTSVRTTDVPLLGQQDTTSNQYALVKITQDGVSLSFHERWCSIDLRNFKADDSEFIDVLKVIVPERYVDAIAILENHALNVPPLSAGAKFVTDRMLEVRGAKLADPEHDPLPSPTDLSHQWDQDRDGHPGLTMTTTGALSGEIYHALRWYVTYSVSVVDDDHLQGLVDTYSEQKILGASKPILVYNTSSIAHPQPDRSYFRAQRLPDDAACADVIALAKTPGSFLEFQGHFDEHKRP